jgi:porphobilinogen synthase
MAKTTALIPSGYPSVYPVTMRRLRANKYIRDLAATSRLHSTEFIQPIFVDEALATREAVRNLKGVYAETLESVVASVEQDLNAGVHKFLLFPVPTEKSENNFRFDFATRVVQLLKSCFGSDIWLANDLCLCSYTAHGHCGIVNAEGTRLLNDETVQTLALYAQTLAEAGADCIAPSDMTDGRVHAIRQKLDAHGFDHTAIMSYSAKFASKLYGPFRDVCKSAPSGSIALQGRTTYQISPDNLHDALQSTFRDLSEGADIVMVKPAAWYLDVVARLRQEITAPIAVYHVSGEYAALELMAEHSLIERSAGHLELWTAFKRAGANVIISYASREATKWIEESR